TIHGPEPMHSTARTRAIVPEPAGLTPGEMGHRRMDGAVRRGQTRPRHHLKSPGTRIRRASRLRKGFMMTDTSPYGAARNQDPPARRPVIRTHHLHKWKQEGKRWGMRSEEHTSELQSRFDLVCRLLLEKKNIGQLLKLILDKHRLVIWSW